MSLKDKVKGIKPKSVSKEPLWLGPESPGPMGGITNSLLCKYLVCKERFRLYSIEGLQSIDSFNHRLEYGNMWHVCEEAHANGDDWIDPLQKYCRVLANKYRTQGDQVNQWYNVCKVQFPIYQNYWAKNPDVKSRKPIFQEKVFEVSYKLPSGRIVQLKGKWDSVDAIGKEGTYLQENKSKGDIDANQIQRQLTFDLQTMIYLIALTECDYEFSQPIRGVRYNVIRRPLSGGKHSIRQKKTQTLVEFYGELGAIIEAEAREASKARTDCFFFFRRKVEITAGDIEKFKQQCLNPLLEEVCNWYNHVAACYKDRVSPFGPGVGVHYRMPYGVYSPLMEGRTTETDEYLASGSELGLERIKTLFPELTSA